MPLQTQQEIPVTPIGAAPLIPYGTQIKYAK